MSIFKFFDTAPKTKSDKFLQLEREGKIHSVIEAIEEERKSRGVAAGTSKDGSVTVKRIGEHHVK